MSLASNDSADRPAPPRHHALPDDPEFARVLRICDPGCALDGPLTFVPDGEWSASWEQWQANFANVIAPMMADAVEHAGHGRAREMQAIDFCIDAALDAASGARSRAAGNRLLRRLSSARGERWLDKFLPWAAASETPAHFATVYAGQGALFHVAPRLLLPSYAYWEWCAAIASCPPRAGGVPVFGFAVSAIESIGKALRPFLAGDAENGFRATLHP